MARWFALVVGLLGVAFLVPPASAGTLLHRVFIPVGLVGASLGNPTPTPRPAPRSFGVGTKRIGVDIVAGTYRGVNTGSGCYWQRLSGFGGSLAEIIANDYVTTGGPVVVAIAPTDAGFSSSSCLTWFEAIYPYRANPVAPFADGTFIIPTDVTPGTWQATGGTSCYWERMSGLGGTFGEIIGNHFGDGSQIVTIAPTDAGFQSRSCGTWSKTG